LNSLIPIISTGPIFTNRFPLDLPLLTMMVQCQLKGYPVLFSLLEFHGDILFGEFVTQSFLQPRRESQLFLGAILANLTEGSFGIFNNVSAVEVHIGALVLIALQLESDRPADRQSEQPSEHLLAAKEILKSIAAVILKNAGAQTMIDEAEDFKFVPTLFGLATEQVIEMGLGILKRNAKFNVVKTIVRHLRPWFESLRLLPKHPSIVPGLPSRFRRFRVISFLDDMLTVSQLLSPELHDVFADLWCLLIKIADNNVVVLLCLFESEDQQTKEKIFAYLLDHEPEMISLYLADRCRFAYWYFMRTQRKQNLSSLGWMFRVLTRGLTDYIDI
jgi:hypothetical protein